MRYQLAKGESYSSLKIEIGWCQILEVFKLFKAEENEICSFQSASVLLVYVTSNRTHRHNVSRKFRAVQIVEKAGQLLLNCNGGPYVNKPTVLYQKPS